MGVDPERPVAEPATTLAYVLGRGQMRHWAGGISNTPIFTTQWWWAINRKTHAADDESYGFPNRASANEMMHLQSNSVKPCSPVRM